MDAYDDRKKEWENLDVTAEELRSITNCMKEKEFRKLLMEYAEEVNDPENRKLYESELTQLEKERGIDVTFVNPEPGYVIKTSVDGRTKCFVNISKNKYVGKPTSQPGKSGDGEGTIGLNWSIPYILAPPREDLDKSKIRCRVFDVVFHPDTLCLAERNINFRKVVNSTAMDGIENNFKVKLDRKNLKFPKMNFKGISQPTVIRKPSNKPVEKSNVDPEIYQKLMSSYDATRERWSKPVEEKCERSTPTTKYYKSRENETLDEDSEYTTPKFVVKYQSSLEMDEFRESKDAKMNSTIPKNLVIVINLPLLKSAEYATLDVQERHLKLESEKPAKYRLNLPLSYKVDPDNGSAKFDSKLRRLIVTLPVIRETSFLVDTKEDSGVESDHGSPLPESQVISNQLISEDLSDFEKPNGPLICVLNDNDQVQSDCDDTALRTSEDLIMIVPFMNPNIKYSLPPFTCNLYDNVFAITIHVKNVDTESIHYKILEDNAGLHILITSIGAGFFPIYYSLCLKVEKDAVLSKTLTVEPWDNNVVVSIQIKNPEIFSRYFVGINEELMETKDLSVAVSIKNKLQALTEDPEIETDKNVEVIRSDNEVIVNVCSESIDSDDDEDHAAKLNSKIDEQKRSIEQCRSISESSGDEIASSIASSTGSGRYKSILKTGHNHFSRSISESSIDDSAAPIHSTTINDFVNEFNSESEGSSLKKTVRFNDVVSRQLFRSNSSIFGQRKKNQRKLKNKKRAQERRLSESENSEGEEREKYKVEVKSVTELTASDTVRPILHQSNKNSNSQKTANIEIERRPRNANKRKQKRNVKTEINSTKGQEKIEIENSSKGIEPWKSFELKNDLMFDLEV